MDSPQLALLKVDLASQKTTIEQVFLSLQSRAQNLDPDNIEKLESVAYQIHNFYGSVEELLKIVANHFENNILDSSKWHSLLLKRMTQTVEGIRPALLSLESYELLNGLRAFRHFFRHAYGVSLDFHQLKANLERVVKLKPLLDQEIELFLHQLS